MTQRVPSQRSRSAYMASMGAVNKIQGAWSWVNRDERFVVFGLFDHHAQDQLIFSHDHDWKYRKDDAIKSQHSVSLKHIELVESDGYALKVFPQINDAEYSEKTGNARVADFYEELHDATLDFDAQNYYAVTQSPVHPQNDQQAFYQRTELDIYFAGLIFPILVELAQNSSQASYKRIAQEVHQRHPDSKVAQNLIPLHVGRRLGAIWTFIEKHGCPHIGALVINLNTGEVGDGFSADLDPKAERERCYSYDWSELTELFDQHLESEKSSLAFYSKKREKLKPEQARNDVSRYYNEHKKEIGQIFGYKDIMDHKDKFVMLVEDGYSAAEAFGEIMSEALKTKRVKPHYDGPEYVYLGQYHDTDSNTPLHDYVKIGYSRDPTLRAKQLAGNVAGPLEFKVLYEWRFANGQAYPAEQWLHGYFEDCQYKGEFFHTRGTWLMDTVIQTVQSKWGLYLA